MGLGRLGAGFGLDGGRQDRRSNLRLRLGRGIGGIFV